MNRKRRTPIRINQEDLFSEHELRVRKRLAIADFIKGTYGSLYGFMESLFDTDGLQPLDEFEACQLLHDSAPITADLNKERTEAYLILGDKDINTFRLFVCGKDTLQEPEGVYYSQSRQFQLVEKWERKQDHVD